MRATGTCSCGCAGCCRQDVPDLAGDTPAEADFLGHLVLGRMGPGARADEIADIARRAARHVDALVGDDDSPVVSFSGMVLGLVWADELEEAERVTDRAIAAARRRGSVVSFSNAMTMRAQARRWAGRLRDAEADARTAFDANIDPAWSFARGLAPLVHALVCRGLPEQAARELDGALEGGDIPESPPMVAVLLARMWIREAQRDHEAALADWRQALRWVTPRPVSAAWIEDLAVVTDAHLAVGDREAAQAVVDDAVPLAAAWGTPRARAIVLVMRARVTGGADAIELLRDAVDLFSESPARFEEARARVALGSALRRAGHRAESREPLRDGYELAQRCGADGLAETARSELRASGIRVRREVASGADALTPSERRIAELAACGLSNPEIAQELFLTVKTIEMHLTRSYRKLDIRGRTALAQALGSPAG
jgi:DNA-binding NarL/FixJ family response regulator